MERDKAEMDKAESEKIETVEMTAEYAESEEAAVPEDWLKFKLDRPVDYQQIHVEALDLSGIKELDGNDMNVIYDLYSSMGGTGTVMQESTLRFAQIAASRATGFPLELFGKLSAKDTVRLKNRMYRFFYL